MSAQGSISCQKKDQIFIIELQRSEKKNAITRHMYQSLTQSLMEAEQLDDIRVIVITGSESCFTAGNDLSDFKNAEQVQDLEPVLTFLNLLPKLKKPLIAAVNGLAIGIGTTVLLHCDLVIADEFSRFQLPFINLAACPEAGSSFLLPRIMGHQKASELLLLGEPFDVKTADQLNLINQITPPGKALNIALEKAAQIAQKPPKAAQLTKALLKRSYLETLNETIQFEGRAFFECLQSQEAKTALAAFFKK